MGLTDVLGRTAVRHAHVFAAEVPGHWLTRVTVERHVLTRGWRLARSPADADVLAVCGPPSRQLAEPLRQLWEQLPGPRTRIDIDSPRAVLAALAAAEVDLLDEVHGGHAGMEHGAMASAGIALAGSGEDRDGLEMDVLHLRLGPVLAYWPAGLVLRCTLHGDVIADAETSLMVAGDNGGAEGPAAAGEQPTSTQDRRWFASRRCDNIASLLGLAGWDDAACRARRIRDALLFTDDLDGPANALHRLRRLVGRSWLLRWSLRRVGPLDAHDLAHRGLPVTLAGDVRDRLLGMLDRAAHGIAGQRLTGTPGGMPVVEAIPDLVRGWDLATARLIVASLDLDPLAADREASNA